MATPIPPNRAAFTLDELARATRGTLRGADARTTSVTTDSRAVVPGSLFVALRGDRFDGHVFLPNVRDAGAVAAVVTKGADVPEGLLAIEVDDTLDALGAIGRYHRERWGGRVVAITGSAGKTTTKELTRAALEGTGAVVLATEGNLNNQIGVPMTLLGLDETHRLAVVEMGTSALGEIERLGAIGRPDVAVVTLVALAHTEGIGTVDAVAKEKGALFHALSGRGLAVANADDPRVRAEALAAPASDRLFYGHAEDADVRLHEVRLDSEGTLARIGVPGRGVLSVRLAVPARTFAQNAAAALAVAYALGIDVEAAARGLATVRATEGRMRPLRTERGALLLDDTYNANPASVLAAIATGAELASARGGRLLLALGDMKELGRHTEEAHASVGRAAASVAAAAFFGLGEAMRVATDAARHGGVAAVSFDDAASLADELREAIRPDDVVLVKGSRSMRMERIVEALRHPERDA